jgi:SpoVK/Ycf46/Vps4 family AAA+-type ATPase
VTFVSYLREHRRRRIDPDYDTSNAVTPEQMLLAILLDLAEFTPEAVDPGRIVMLCIDRELHQAVIRLLGEVAADRNRAKSPDRSTERNDVVFAWGGRTDIDALLLGTAKTGSAFVVLRGADDDGRVPPNTSQALERIYRAPHCTEAIIEELIFQMLDARVSVPSGEYVIAHVLIALRPSTTAADEALRLLYKLNDTATEGFDSSDSAKTEEEAAGRSSGKDEQNGDEAEVETPASPSEPSVIRLRDLSGYGPARDWGMQLAADLALYREGNLAWVDVDKGALLSGPPGCGKTFYAKALAAECHVELIECSYGDLEAKTGSGNLIVKAIKQIFADARKKAPCIVFFDEIDSIGARGTRSHNSGWFDAIVNGVLGELDGAKPRDGVVVVAATNRPEIIDPALLRPGRLERHIAIPKPTIADIRGFLLHHLGVVDGLDQAARACRGRSPAEISQIAREARRLARRDGRKVKGADVEVIARAEFERSEGADRVIAVHESGHALVSAALGVGLDCLDVDHCVTFNVPFEMLNLADIERQIAICMAGRVAEEALIGSATAGSAGDVDHATRFAIHAIVSGLEGPPIPVGDVHGEVATALSRPGVRDRVDKMLAAGLDRTREIVAKRLDDLRRLADAAQKERYLDGDQIEAIVGGRKRSGRSIKTAKPGRSTRVRSPNRCELRTGLRSNSLPTSRVTRRRPARVACAAR